MEKNVINSATNIVQVPLDMFFKEAESQKERVLFEVMEFLFSALPKNINRPSDFVLSDGTTCWLKAFSEPKIREDGKLSYGFDVSFGEGAALSHLEFFVKCSGWERALPVPNPD